MSLFLGRSSVVLEFLFYPFFMPILNYVFVYFESSQYVFDMRQKDRSICLPFDSDGDSEQLLPPMVVPKYKYWLCENCLGS